MSYQLINNLFSRASIPGPRETMKRTQTKGEQGLPQYPLCSRLLIFTHDRNKVIPATILVKFSKIMFPSSLYTADEKSKLTGRLSSFTNPFILPCDDHKNDVDNLF